MAELNLAVIKKTQDSLGKFVKKPNLTEKLLRKPPFKFLHDVINAVIKNTGYLKDLYNDEELISENIKDRDGKIAFLQKAIDAVKLSTNENIKARPSKIVAGLEPEKTNEFLQAIGRAIEMKIDSGDAVIQVKNGNVPTDVTKQQLAASKTEPSKARKVVKQSSVSKKNDAKTIDTKPKKKTETGSKVVKQSSKESGGSKTVKSKIEKKNESKSNEGVKKAAESLQSKKKVERISSNEGEEKNDIPKPLEIPPKTRPEETKQVVISEKEKIIEPERETSHLTKVKSEEEQESKDSVKETPPSEPIDTVKEKKSNKNEKQSVEVPSKEIIDQQPVDPVNKVSVEPLLQKSNENDEKRPKPGTALRSAALRPVSARPSAPRRHDRNVKQILHSDSFNQDTAPKKIDKKDLMAEYDDGDNIIIADALQENASTGEYAADVIDKDSDKKQGHLVQQILETQTAILKTDSKSESTAISDETSVTDKKTVSRKMTDLRKSIQKLSFYITPLGKLMEYFQEDVDAMQIELLMWQNAYSAAETEIRDEQKKTESVLEAFKFQLADISNGIKEHTEQINNATTNILQNEEKISKLVSSL